MKSGLQSIIFALAKAGLPCPPSVNNFHTGSCDTCRDTLWLFLNFCSPQNLKVLSCLFIKFLLYPAEPLLTVQKRGWVFCIFRNKL